MARWRGLHRKFADPCNTCITRGRALIVPRRRPRRANIGPRSKRLPTDTSCTPGASLFNRSSLYRGPHYHEYNCEGGGELRLVAAASGPRHPDTNGEMYSPLQRPRISIHCSPIRRLSSAPHSIFPVAKLLTSRLPFSCFPPPFSRERGEKGVFWLLAMIEVLRSFIKRSWSSTVYIVNGC